MRVSTYAATSIALAAQCMAFAPSLSSLRTATELQMSNPTESVFLTPESAKKCIDVADGTPLYAYSMNKLNENADSCLSFPNAFGLTVRYAMKACPNGSILKLFNKKGIHIDASSGHEVSMCILYHLVFILTSKWISISLRNVGSSCNV